MKFHGDVRLEANFKVFFFLLALCYSCCICPLFFNQQILLWKAFYGSLFADLRKRISYDDSIRKVCWDKEVVFHRTMEELDNKIRTGGLGAMSAQIAKSILLTAKAAAYVKCKSKKCNYFRYF